MGGVPGEGQVRVAGDPVRGRGPSRGRTRACDDRCPRRRHRAGSHRWGLLPVTGLVGDMDQVHDVLDGEQREAMANPVAVELKAGECTFHHAMLMHGSGRNRTDHPRRGAVINVVRDGVISTVDEPLLAGQPVIGSGNPLGGAFHPLLSASSGRTP